MKERIQNTISFRRYHYVNMEDLNVSVKSARSRGIRIRFHYLMKSLQNHFLLLELLLQTCTEPGFSMRRTVSSVIGSISGLILPDGSSDPFTCSRLIFTAVIARQEMIEGNESRQKNGRRHSSFGGIFKRHVWQRDKQHVPISFKVVTLACIKRPFVQKNIPQFNLDLTIKTQS